jgi:hypothetical protein
VDLCGGGDPAPRPRRRPRVESFNSKPTPKRITRKFDIKAKPVRWLEFFLDCRLNWQAHVKHRLALGHHRIRTISRVMNANGVPRKLARKIAWAVSMSTAAYGIEAIWEGQTWLLDGFNKLSMAIGQAVVGTFSTTKGEDTIRAADIPPTQPALDRRKERLLASALAAPENSPKRALLPPPAEDDSTRHRPSKWFRGASGDRKLVRDGQPMEHISPWPRDRTRWSSPQDLPTDSRLN